MDLGTVVTGLIIIALCVFLFLIMNRGNKRSKKSMLNVLFDFAAQSENVIGRCDVWLNGAIGVDAKNHKLFFLRLRRGERQLLRVDLLLYKRARINSVLRPGSKDGALHSVEKLEIILDAIDNKQSDLVLEFYNVDHDSLRLMGESVLVDKWNANINDLLKSSEISGK